MGNISKPWGDAPREDVTDTAAAEKVDPSDAGQESADHAGLPRACGGGNTHSHTTDAQTVGARPGRDLGALGGVIPALTATTGGPTRWPHDWYSSGSILTLPRCHEPFRTYSAMSMSCEVVIDGDRRNGGPRSAGLRARGLEPAA